MLCPVGWIKCQAYWSSTSPFLHTKWGKPRVADQHIRNIINANGIVISLTDILEASWLAGFVVRVCKDQVEYSKAD